MSDTKKAALLELLAGQWVTVQIAQQKCGLNSLAQRISNWRAQGYEFHQRTIQIDKHTRIAAYKLARAPEKETA